VHEFAILIVVYTAVCEICLDEDCLLYAAELQDGPVDLQLSDAFHLSDAMYFCQRGMEVPSPTFS